MDNEYLKEKVLILLFKIGNTIKSKRTSQKITIFDLAKKAGVSPSVISDLENCKGVMPNIYTLVAIAKALDLSEKAFLEFIWGEVNKDNEPCDLTPEEKLMAALFEYGLPACFHESIINYINYLISSNKSSNRLDQCSERIFSAFKKLSKNKD